MKHKTVLIAINTEFLKILQQGHYSELTPLSGMEICPLSYGLRNSLQLLSLRSTRSLRVLISQRFPRSPTHQISGVAEASAMPFPSQPLRWAPLAAPDALCALEWAKAQSRGGTTLSVEVPPVPPAPGGAASPGRNGAVTQ